MVDFDFPSGFSSQVPAWHCDCAQTRVSLGRADNEATVRALRDSLKVIMVNIRMSNWAPAAPATIVLLALFVCGCGETSTVERASVSGNVTLDGSPVSAGQIQFIPTGDTKGPASYGIIKDGRYSIPEDQKGPVVGNNQVRINSSRETGEKDDIGDPIVEEAIPPEYNTKTTLKVVIEAGEDLHDFELKSEKSE